MNYRLTSLITTLTLGASTIASAQGTRLLRHPTVSKDLVDVGVSAADLARDAAKALGGGTAKNAELVQGGGPKVDAIDDALALLTDATSSAARA